MQVTYDSKKDLLYFRFDERKQDIVNKRMSDDIVLDIGEDDKIVGIEILDASFRLNLEYLFPIRREEIVDASPKRVFS